jgi:hypothetical protein
MNQAWIVVKNTRGVDTVRDPALEPHSMTDVWYSTPESPLPARARVLSQGGAALAVQTWEEDMLRLWAFRDGHLEVEYDASPSAISCTITPPASSGTGDLATVFGVPESSVAVNKLLTRKKGLGFISETQRLERLLELLGLPASQTITV